MNSPRTKVTRCFLKNTSFRTSKYALQRKLWLELQEERKKHTKNNTLSIAVFQFFKKLSLYNER